MVALSANAMPRDIEKGLQAGFFRYLTKPIRVNEFMETLEAALEFARSDGLSRGVKCSGQPSRYSERRNPDCRRQGSQRQAARGHAARGRLYTPFDSTSDPSEVCELHRKNRYGLILLDLQMPGMDGFQVMEGLKEIEADGYLPVLVITAQPSHKLRALEAGAKDFVSKPFDLAELRARVHNILEVRLLHLEAKRYSQALEETVRELEASREVIRLKTLDEQKRNEQELILAQETQESLLPHIAASVSGIIASTLSTSYPLCGRGFLRFPAAGFGRMDGSAGGCLRQRDARRVAEFDGAGRAQHGIPRRALRPQEVLNRVNRLLCEKSLAFQFVTLFLFLLNPAGEGQFISAGHNPVWLFRAAAGRIEDLAAQAPVLGVFPAAAYQPRPLHLCKGDILVVYSDGLTDAENPQGEMFGEGRLREIIRREAPSGGQAVEQAFLAAIADFTQGMPQMDDITFMVVERA